DQPRAAVDQVALYDRAQLEEMPVLLGGAEAHDVFHAGAVVPAPIEYHDLFAGRKALDVALHVHLCLLAVGRRGERHDAEHARADPLGEGLDGAALARGVTAFKNDDHALLALLEPGLQFAQLFLQLEHLLFVDLALQLFGDVLWHGGPPPYWRHSRTLDGDGTSPD